ncbi:MAG: EscV/YscV/HrcV family type III secretion system export apparatus protein [Enterobacterales bacterium endosymbiont of Blomia tropicalis]|uniref:EscV/YscV/HrcV family type III secretion system export apparatus protein n=1 Tax=Mixta mediterraneensis TaxID=2758443 RepID=UPI0025A8E94D|nr:EscV/YscV/HrcV family type III secretion system export apparatus protein [Mixta mediterraneensis]MDL4914950.1 EscV/YscV/HrcV family type III secretion system export apparatus protein [Mixta mediterraneensis]
MLQRISQRPELFIVVLMVTILAMLIIPLPTWLIDFLLAVNIIFSVLIFIGTFYIQKILDFSSLPSLLLITTLFRLALSISTSRMILIQADAGHIITTFGNFVISGDIIIGLIIFAIITLFQFIVITKGSERVAEVCARFSLDAMPGKQMSIDADLKAGSLDAETAKKNRLSLEKESQLYGALDGTMKFIKGDAIASIVIIFVNFIGGISIGMGRHNMDFSHATEVYTILTIGDALVAQIPALLISIGTGFVVTRVSEDGKNLGENIIEQIFRRDFVLLVTALISLLIGLLPGFPTVVFAGISLLIFALCFSRRLKADKAEKATGDEDSKEYGGFYQQSETDEASLHDVIPETIPLMLLVPQQSEAGPALKNLSLRLKKDFFINFGIHLPEIRILTKPNMSPDTALLLINEVAAGELPVVFDHCKVLYWNEALSLCDINIKVLNEGNKSFQWISKRDSEQVNLPNVILRDWEHELSLSFQSAVAFNIAEFFGIQEMKHILDKMEANYPELLKEVYRHMTVQRITEVLHRLIKEKISVRNMKVVMEALAFWGGKERDTIMLVEHVRAAMARYISDKFAVNNKISAFVLSPEVEKRIRRGIRNTSTGSFINLEPEDSEFIHQAFQENLASSLWSLKDIVLLTAVDIRRYTKRLIENDFTELEVLSFGEISNTVKVNVIHTV